MSSRSTICCPDMEPWELAEHIAAAMEQETILKGIRENDPFWVGASYAIDPFVGVIYQLPLYDPPRYERGLPAQTFDIVCKAILGGELRADNLAKAIEAMSRACRPDEWTKWYRPILEGGLDLKLPLTLYNKYAPVPISPPVLSKPKPLTPKQAAGPGLPPKHFFVQPELEGRCFWTLDSRTAKIDVRGYREDCTRIRDPQIEESLKDLGKKNPVDLVIFGYLSDGFVCDDLVTRDQFIRESSLYPLQQRLDAAARLGLPIIQRSEILTEFADPFFKELQLIFDQRHKSAIVRDLTAPYPFRAQTDYRFHSRSWLNAGM
jgi:hypothetical protein